MNLDTLLLIIAFVCFLIEAFRGLVSVNVGVHFGWLGLALWVLTALI